MTYQCKICSAEYRSHETLMRHVRTKHPKKIIKCNLCTYVVSSSVKYRMEQHQKARHGLNKPQVTEAIIPITPDYKRPKPQFKPNTKKPAKTAKTTKIKEKHSS